MGPKLARSRVRRQGSLFMPEKLRSRRGDRWQELPDPLRVGANGSTPSRSDRCATPLQREDFLEACAKTAVPEGGRQVRRGTRQIRPLERGLAWLPPLADGR